MSTPAISSTSVSGVNRNNFDGRVGLKFVVGGSDIDVVSLGRWVTSGNSQTHTVEILASDGSTVVATASVNTSGASAGAYKYQSITPVTLTASTTYFLVSAETNGGDNFQDYPNTVTPDAAISIPQAAFGIGAASVSGAGSTNEAYVTVNFEFDAGGSGDSLLPLVACDMRNMCDMAGMRG